MLSIGKSVKRHELQFHDSLIGANHSPTSQLVIYDYFASPDGPLTGRITPDGTPWSVTGAAYANAQIVNERLVHSGVSGAFYCYLPFAESVSASVSWESGGDNIDGRDLTVALADADGSLANLIHLNFGVSSWELTKRIASGAFVTIDSGAYWIRIDGSTHPVKLTLDTSTNTLDIVLPSGDTRSYTDADFATVNPKFCFFEIFPNSVSPGPKGRFDAVAVGKRKNDAAISLDAAATKKDIASLMGYKNTQVKTSEFTTAAVGYYTISKAVANVTYMQSGRCQIIAESSSGYHILDILFDAIAFSTAPKVSILANTRYGLNAVDKIRISTLASSPYGVNLDLHVNTASQLRWRCKFYGLSGPIKTPVVGAVALGSASVEITPFVGRQSLVPVVVGASSDATVSYQVPSDGFSLIIPDECNCYVLDPTAGLASGTITMPANPIDGQKITISSTQSVTNLTMSGNTGKTISNPRTTIAAGDTISYRYRASNAKWYPA